MMIIGTATLPIDAARTYIFTGDIKEMWLRDSEAQAHPLVTVMLPRFPSLLPMLVGVLRQQAEFILSDPYGSAFGRCVLCLRCQMSSVLQCESVCVCVCVCLCLSVSACLYTMMRHPIIIR